MRSKVETELGQLVEHLGVWVPMKSSSPMCELWEQFACPPLSLSQHSLFPVHSLFQLFSLGIKRPTVQIKLDKDFPPHSLPTRPALLHSVKVQGQIVHISKLSPSHQDEGQSCTTAVPLHVPLVGYLPTPNNAPWQG